VYEVAVSVELPETAEQGAVINLQRALLRAIQDQLQVSLDDEDAAAVLVDSAMLTTSLATRNNGVGAKDTYLYTLTAWLPVALVGQALGGGGRRRALAAGAIPAALDGLQQSGYLLQRLHELGFDADALASSGALGVSGGLVAPPSTSPSPTASSGVGGAATAVASATLTLAAVLGIAAAVLALFLASVYCVCNWCAWKRCAARLKRGAGDGGAPESIARAGGVILHLREDAGVPPSSSLSSTTNIYAAFGEGADGGDPIA
jgi:hypothetical protein